MHKEGPIKEASYYYPAKRINEFMKRLPETDETESLFAHIPDKVFVMTHDDIYDVKMAIIEQEYRVKSTWFLLANSLAQTPKPDADVQLHFDKERNSLPNQIQLFERIFHKRPIFGRNHRLLWRADNFDFPYLALNGFKADSTKIGVKPYRVCINGKILPIWEIPFSITDSPTDKIMALYNVAKNVETMFVKEVTPITILAHPFSVVKEKGLQSCFQEVLECSQRYGYKSMNMTEFYNKYLNDIW